jgi:21S rRNA (GM2251-2'-O)-methyltransferase
LTNKYPSLSFGKPKFPKQQTESDVTERLPDRQRQSHAGRSHEQEQGSNSRPRHSYSEERNFERRPTDSANAYTPRSSTKGTTVNAVRRKDYDGKMDSGKPYEDSSTTRPRFTNTMDSRSPLSITYTTPASEFLYGTSVVEAALRSTRIPRRQHYKFYICAGENRENTKKDAEMERLARNKQVEVIKMSGDGLRLMDKMSSGRPHNGYILEASPLPRLPITSMGELTTKDNQFGFEVGVESQSKEEAAVNGTSNFVRIPTPKGGRKPMVLLLDSIVDPGNLGGIIRTASFLGVSAVAISAQGGANFSPVVLKASAGASENLPIFTVNNPTGFARDSKQAGWKVYAAVAPRSCTDSFKPVSSMSTEDLLDPLAEDPCILMVGGEGDGLPKFLRSKADVEIHIPSRGGNHIVDSLNVNVATGILCNAFLSKSKVERAPTEGQGEPQESPSSDRLF